MTARRNDLRYLFGRYPYWRIWLVAQWLLLFALLFFVIRTAVGQTQSSATGDATRVITLREAIETALSENGSARLGIAKQLAEQARARDRQARAALLPNVDGSVSQSSQTRNLQAMGIDLAVPLPGFTAPRFVGPFEVFDARISATQSLLQVGSIQRYRAAKEATKAADAEEAYLREAVVSQVAKAYFAVQAAEAQYASAQATLQLAKDLETLAQQQKDAGTGIALEVTRARVQRSRAEQTLIRREADRNAACLHLLRAVGDPMSETALRTENMHPPLDAPPSLDGSLARAFGERDDLSAQKHRQAAAQLSYSANKWDRAPSVIAFGDYGASGNRPGNALATRAVGVSAQIPLFDGGRRDARRAEASAKQREEEFRTRDLRQQVELEIRLALDALGSTRSQADVATLAAGQAELELEQARRRYAAGVSSSLEITRALTTVEEARAAKIEALYRYHLARADFALASGDAGSIAP